MLTDAKILVTGATGSVAASIIRFLAPHNEVWGAARFSREGSRDDVEALGAKPVSVDLASGDLYALPDDFTNVLHLAHFRGAPSDVHEAIRNNGEGTGHLLHHCRKAKAALVMSSGAVYSAVEDPWDFPSEDSPIGSAFTPWAPTSGPSKVAQEAVARFCAVAFGLPVVITRLNTVYADAQGFLPPINMDTIMRDMPVSVRWAPMPHHPIHIDDLCLQLEAMLDAASTPANIVNWGGDEVVTTQEWCTMVGEWSGKEVTLKTEPVTGATHTAGSDQTRRKAITGPSTIDFRQAFRAIFDARYGGAAD
ncbi:MAG: NAD(P)-dependent oxidoreductase [Alphaproteobacteria bacterium]|nr:NAD(P)-dependent oxidoreductase [Alphaproteobacteria bacterium]